MKVCINIKKIPGPFGGGMIFSRDLEKELTGKNVQVVHDLKDGDIDIILHVNPFPFLMKSAAFSFFDAFIYKLKHPFTVIVQGIHECDERKGTNYMNRLLVKACKYSDYVVYVSSWLEPLLKQNCLDPKKPSKVILHGSSKEIFNRKGKIFWDHKRPLKLVTHHWGAHPLKGHDIYQKIDRLLNEETFAKKFAFTFIGNCPKNLTYKNTTLIPPLSGDALGVELKKNDVYVTASRNEPAGLHHIEGALCGLPIMYINSGALPEYCEGFGLEFDENNFEKKLDEMYLNYDYFVSKIQNYNRTSDKMAEQYYGLLSDLFKNKNQFCLRAKHTNVKIFLYTVYNKLFDLSWRIKNKIKKLFAGTGQQEN